MELVKVEWCTLVCFSEIISALVNAWLNILKSIIVKTSNFVCSILISIQRGGECLDTACHVLESASKYQQSWSCVCDDRFGHPTPAETHPVPFSHSAGSSPLACTINFNFLFSTFTLLPRPSQAARCRDVTGSSPEVAASSTAAMRTNSAAADQSGTFPPARWHGAQAPAPRRAAGNLLSCNEYSRCVRLMGVGGSQEQRSMDKGGPCG